ncbi:unnamed protein product [Lactuca virosa]|uniref:SWIM-type domain-containing protein n=1 Tax=Lactuca virosa TaxID=75947 RepID=A0AAU9MZF3_9ASTR|nr:unnamed protein product [Lactuca virosa]
MSIEWEEGIDLTDFMSPQKSNMEGVTYEGVNQANGNEDVTEGDPKYDEDENIPDVKGKQMFNEDIYWKKQIPVLGMRYRQVLPSGLNTFETRNLGESYGVDLEKKTCTCRIWQLNGYGCVHSVATICYVNRDVEEFVDPLYRACIYMNTYKYSIGSMNGSAIWPPTDYIPPFPPLKRKIPGRPNIKRKRDNTEVSGSHRVSKSGKKIVCGVCKKAGHNKSTCDAVSKTQKSKVKKRKAEGEGETSALKKVKGQVQKGNGVNKGKGEDKRGSGIGFKTGQGECGSTSVVNKKNGTKEGTVKLRKKSGRIIKKKLAKKVEGKNGEGDTSTKPMDLD